MAVSIEIVHCPAENEVEVADAMRPNTSRTSQTSLVFRPQKGVPGENTYQCSADSGEFPTERGA